MTRFSLVATLTIIILVVCARGWLPAATFDQWLMAERGLLELGTAICLLPAIVAALALLRYRRHLPEKRLALWFGACALGCIYFAGEELSWGQHLLGWDTPKSLANLNDQGETNLHNMSSWLDQKPRLMLEIWLLFGTVIALGRGLKKTRFDHRNAAHWFWPWPAAACFAGGAIIVRIPERIAGWSDWTPPYLLSFRLSELQELLFAAALATYLLQAYRQAAASLRQNKHGPQP